MKTANGMKIVKPILVPIGPVPLDIWEQQRIEDLNRAISENIQRGLYELVILDWIGELRERVSNKINIVVV